MNHSTEPTVIVGAGFTGLFTALHLRHQRYPDPIILIDPQERFVFKPMLYEFLTGELQEDAVCPTYEDLLENSEITFVQDRVAAIDLHQKQVDLASGLQYTYRHLVLGVGSVQGYLGTEGAQAATVQSKANDPIVLGENVMFDLPLNNENLPYPDTIHPIIVHFVIAMVFFAYFCDIVGYLSRNHRMFEVSWWNMVVASIAVFFAVIFGEFEAGLAEPYSAAQHVLDWHTINGWSLSAILVTITAWRGIIRIRDPLKIPVAYLGVATILMCLVCLQIYLGDLVDWVYSLHTVPVVEATRKGLLK